MMKIINPFRSIPVCVTRMYRVSKVENRPEIVWNELIKLHKKENWHFELDRYTKSILTTFIDKNKIIYSFQYVIRDDYNLTMRAFIIDEFDVERTKDLMILSSHLNSRLNFGIIRVNIRDNYIEFTFSENLLIYHLFPGEIHKDIVSHFQITENCYWAFTHLLNSGDDPVFVFAEFMKRQSTENQE